LDKELTLMPENWHPLLGQCQTLDWPVAAPFGFWGPKAEEDKGCKHPSGKADSSEQSFLGEYPFDKRHKSNQNGRSFVF